MFNHLLRLRPSARLALPWALASSLACQTQASAPARSDMPPAAEDAEKSRAAVRSNPAPAAPAQMLNVAGSPMPATLDSAPQGCATDPRVTAFVPNLLLSGGELQIRVLSTQPPGALAPGMGSPQMGINSMTVQLLDRRGKPLQGARVSLEASMPDHAHGGAQVVAKAAGGAYRLSDFELMMPGVWKFNFAIKAPGQRPHQISVHFCIPG